MDVGVTLAGSNSVVQYWPLCYCSELLHEGEIFLNMAGGLSNLNEPLVSHAQDFSEDQNVLVTHGIGHHW